MASPQINYGLRPAKQIGRSMVFETVRRLAHFGNLDEYRYVGFGSYFFHDFRIVHRELGIRDMVTIEGDRQLEDRVRFNRPYACIDVRIGWSNVVLPTLDWSKAAVVWLDYTDSLNEVAFEDVKTVLTSAKPGSFLLITVNAEPLWRPCHGVETETRDDLTRVLSGFREQVGRERVRPDTKLKDLAGQNMAIEYRSLIDREIASVVRDENACRKVGNKLTYQQLINIRYRDGARMLTVGGLIYLDSQMDRYGKCQFESLPFVRLVDAPLDISVPVLTHKERRHLDRQLPCEAVDDLDAPGVGLSDKRDYHCVYRHFPNYAEVDV